MARLAIGVMGAAAALAPAVAAACGALPTPFVTLVGGLPAARDGLPRDGAVVVRGKLWGPSGGPTNFAEIRLLDEAGNAIPAVQEPWYGAEPSLAIRPQAPLPARTRFVVETVVPEGPARPPAADGPLSLRLTFETGDDLATPLVLAGPLRVTLERFDADAVTCANDAVGCAGATCTKVGTRRALRARIVVPAASGGVDFDGYRGWLRFTDDQPVVFAGPGEGSRAPGNVNLAHFIQPAPGLETEIVQEIVEEDGAYAPCFALNLWDPAGHAVQAAPVCLASITASEHLRELDRADAGGGCSLASGSQRGSGLLVIALAGLSLLLARRRR